MASSDPFNITDRPQLFNMERLQADLSRFNVKFSPTATRAELIRAYNASLVPHKGNIAVLTQMMGANAGAKAPATPLKVAAPATPVKTVAASPVKKAAATPAAAAAAADDNGIPAAVRRLTDQELRAKFAELGAVCPPVTATTRPLIERRYVKLLLGRDDLDVSPAKPAAVAHEDELAISDEGSASDEEEVAVAKSAKTRVGTPVRTKKVPATPVALDKRVARSVLVADADVVAAVAASAVAAATPKPAKTPRKPAATSASAAKRAVAATALFSDDDDVPEAAAPAQASPKKKVTADVLPVEAPAVAAAAAPAVVPVVPATESAASNSIGRLVVVLAVLYAFYYSFLCLTGGAGGIESLLALAPGSRQGALN